MISISADPTNPDRLVLTQTVTLYLDRLLLSTLSAELETAIRAQAALDIRGSKAVRKAISSAAQAHLMKLLGVEAPAGKKTDPVAAAPEIGEE